MANVVIDLSTLVPEQGFIIQGTITGDGFVVAGSGDFNGDGIDDLIVGSNNGRQVYVVFGTDAGFGEEVAGRQVIDLATLSPSQGFVVLGDGEFVAPAGDLSSAGDVNGDGIDDLVTGQVGGGSYVIFGSDTGFGSEVAGRQVVDVTALAPAQGFRIAQEDVFDILGIAVSSAGDINRDGFDDVLVGAPQPINEGGIGNAYVIFGTDEGFGTEIAGERVIDLASLAPSAGFIIRGDSDGKFAGWDVALAGDVNDDGFDDLIIGAVGDTAGGSQAGAAYVIFGTDKGLGEEVAGRQIIDLSDLAPERGFVIHGDVAGGRVGESVAGAGDVNGDGIADLIVGATGAGDEETPGVVYVIFGSGAGFGSKVADRQVLDLTDLTPDQGFSISGAVGQIGRSISGAGDINDDGIDDLIIGGPRDSFGEDSGAAYVIFGRLGTGRDNVDLSALGGEGFVISGTGASTGLSVASAGDVNDDGIEDLIVGSPANIFDENAGEAYVIFGSVGIGNQAPIVDPLEREYTTLVNTPFTFLVNAVDPNGDLLNFTPGAALHGTVVVTPVAFTYTPEQGFSGTDSFLVTVDDGRDGVAEQLVTVTVAALPAPSDWRLFASDGYIGEIGGNGAVIGRPAYQNIKVTDVPGRVSFDPSFNRGGDIIRLSGDAEDWRVVRLGSGAVFSDDDTFVTVPVGTTGLQVIFDDGIRVLRIEGGELKLNYQVITTVLEPIFVPAQDELPVTNVPNPLGRLFLSPEAAVVAGANGRLDVFGTSAEEEVRILYGNVKLDPSFNRGGDVLVLDRPAEDFTAVRSGSSIQLDSIDVDVLIPISTAETTIRFADGDRTITFDTLANSAVIGDQLIGFSSVQLIA